jgi:hypothetical protein
MFAALPAAADSPEVDRGPTNSESTRHRVPTWSAGTALFANISMGAWFPYTQLSLERRLTDNSPLAWTGEVGGSVVRYGYENDDWLVSSARVATGLRWFFADHAVVRPSAHVMATTEMFWVEDDEADVSVGGRLGVAADTHLSEAAILRIGMDVAEARHVVDGGLMEETGTDLMSLGISPRVELRIGW